MLDLSKYKNRVEVPYEEYISFIDWYMKKCNIRVLKIRDTVGSRTVIDKKSKEQVCQTITKGYDTGYLIWESFYTEWKDII